MRFDKGQMLGSEEFGQKIQKAHAFSLLDLLLIVGAVVFFSVWFVFEHTGEHARIAQCSNNLRVLGQAMQSYANDHNDELPAAVIDLGDTHISWDTKIFPYLNPKIQAATNNNSNSGYIQRKHAMDLAHWFHCPSDSIQREGIPRSYAMAEHDMSLNDWPPRYDSSSGPGLFWDSAWITNVMTSEEAERCTDDPDLLPKIKLSDIPDAADTLLITEYLNRINILQDMGYARVGNVEEQKNAFNGNSSSFHYGKFNYLMVDDHVELLSGFQTGGETGRGGIWTMKAGD